jgi:RimJ/RimL family protein N-acetyltransferase
MADEPAENPVEHPILNITGDKIALGPIRRDLVPLYQRWINDFEVTRTLGIGTGPMTLEAEQAWYDGASRRGHDALFTIYERVTLRPIGNTGLHDVDLSHGTAEFGIVIGDKECWGRGCGTEAATLMLDYGFHALGLHNIWLRVYDFNERGIRAYTRAGFREIGRRREAVRRGQRYYDLVLMDCLAPKFEGQVLRRLLAPGGGDPP